MGRRMTLKEADATVGIIAVVVAASCFVVGAAWAVWKCLKLLLAPI